MDNPNTNIPVPCASSSPGWNTSAHKAPPQSPLYDIKVVQRWINVTSANLTQTLRVACVNVGGSLVLLPKQISSWSLQSSGTMALLLGNVETDTIRIIGRWSSDYMLCYLHVTARPLMKGHAANIVATGDYTLILAATFISSSDGTPAGWCGLLGGGMAGIFGLGLSKFHLKPTSYLPLCIH